LIKKALLPLILFVSQALFSQLEKDIYRLNALDELLTSEVKKVIDLNVKNDETIFLGESVHYSGSDFLAKIEFVKYLVTEHSYKDIAFEGDFFALQFDHNKRSLYRMWSQSSQCKELFEFLEKHEVRIWGFDNRIGTPYSQKYFPLKLAKFLKENQLKLDKDFERLSKIITQDEYDIQKTLNKKEIEYVKAYTSKLLSYGCVKQSKTWNQILESFKSAIDLYAVKDNYSDKKRNPIRDTQMAKNLNFLVNQNPDKKFMVWLANGHMSKSNENWMNGKTMGYQFRELNPNPTYHIAFGSMRLPPRDEKDIQKAVENDKNILSLLPSINDNYFIDTKHIIDTNEKFKHEEISDLHIFINDSKKSKLFVHFDALVMIANGEEVKYDK
jgi:erythromycin esterase